MKRKAAVRYLLHSYRNPLLIFYGIILLVSLLVCTLMEVQVAGEGKVSSVNGASVIFLFVCGLNAFKEDFCFFLQNGVSRNAVFRNLHCVFAGCTSNGGCGFSDDCLVLHPFLLRGNPWPDLWQSDGNRLHRLSAPNWLAVLPVSIRLIVGLPDHYAVLSDGLQAQGAGVGQCAGSACLGAAAHRY